MDAYDILSQINELLTTAGKSDKETLTAIDDLVSEFFCISKRRAGGRVMIIKVTEKCLTETNEIEHYALRHYEYKTNRTTLVEALTDCVMDFNSDHIVANSSHDDFEGECLSSEVIKVEIQEEE